MRLPCRSCQDGTPLPFAFTMAFQPIVDIVRGRVWAYEALVRGPQGQGAATILGQVTADTLYKFDQACRVRAIALAGRLFPVDESTIVSINFMPNAVYEPSACIRTSLEAARRAGLPHHRLMFEFTEDERIMDPAHVTRIVHEYKRQGLLTAIDDFGSGYSGLTLLANLRTDVIKVDMELVRGIPTDRVRQAIVAGLVAMARAIGTDIVAEGIETEAEAQTLRGLGIALLQGYYFARPALESLPEVTFQRAPPLTTPAPACAP